MSGSRFYCIKELVFHIATVEDRWIHLAILRDEQVPKINPALKDIHDDGPIHTSMSLSTLLDYWRAVESSTLSHLATLTDDEINRFGWWADAS